MLRFLYDYFFKKIIFDEQLIADIRALSDIRWLENIGQPIGAIDCKYDIVQVSSEKEALKLLRYRMSSNGFVTVAGLLNEGSNRSSGYLSEHRAREFDTEWNEVTRKADQYLDFGMLDRAVTTFKQKYAADLNLQLREYLYDYIHCLYFKKADPSFPTFGLDVFDIYRQGHAIVGFKGEFLSGFDEEISTEDGAIVVW